MTCRNCGGEMVISEWDGWKWFCIFCDRFDREATDDEVEEYEKEIYG